MAKPKPKSRPALRPIPREFAPPRDLPGPEAHGAYPTLRMRRNRADAWTRRLVAESRLSVDDLIWPVFIQDNLGAAAIESMPGVQRLGPDRLIDAIGAAAEMKIPAIALFPYVDPALKTPDGIEALNPDNLVCRAIRDVKAAFPDLGIVCDAALDPFNSQGHDGILRGDKIMNDETVELLCRQSVAQAEAGCDIIAPSDMMDGRVGAIRRALDAAGYQDVRILSYAAKYASAFYGPFREAIGSAGALIGDKKTYQMDPANALEALREVELDLAEGADMVMVKPGMPYLDVIRQVKDTFGVPTFAYQVSGEYAMLKAAVQNGWLDNDRVVMESLLAFKRAGADGILTYMAPEAAARLQAG
jgi:porphobilinogen synthase